MAAGCGGSRPASAGVDEGDPHALAEASRVASATLSAGGDADGDAERRSGGHATPDDPPLGGDGAADNGDPTAGSVPSVVGGSASSGKVAANGSPPRRQWGGAPEIRRRSTRRRLPRQLARPTRRRRRTATSARWRSSTSSAVGGGRGSSRGLTATGRPGASAPPRSQGHDLRGDGIAAATREPPSTAPDRHPVGAARRRHVSPPPTAVPAVGQQAGRGRAGGCGPRRQRRAKPDDPQKAESGRGGR